MWGASRHESWAKHEPRPLENRFGRGDCLAVRSFGLRREELPAQRALSHADSGRGRVHEHRRIPQFVLERLLRPLRERRDGDLAKRLFLRRDDGEPGDVLRHHLEQQSFLHSDLRESLLGNGDGFGDDFRLDDLGNLLGHADGRGLGCRLLLAGQRELCHAVQLLPDSDRHDGPDRDADADPVNGP